MLKQKHKDFMSLKKAFEDECDDFECIDVEEEVFQKLENL